LLNPPILAPSHHARDNKCKKLVVIGDEDLNNPAILALAWEVIHPAILALAREEERLSAIFPYLCRLVNLLVY